MTEDRMPHVDLYKAADGWRWRYVAANGNVLADSGESYDRSRDAITGVSRVTGAGYRDFDDQPHLLRPDGVQIPIRVIES